ncbi:MAG: PspC domain-containing protein [Oscillospiraceae bacterium]|nr:PspC domain-containing protein [Oscillospiraceae bacterium]
MEKNLVLTLHKIAEYLGIDPTIVRILWILAIAVFGNGIFAYIVCALFMPKDCA